MALKQPVKQVQGMVQGDKETFNILPTLPNISFEAG
jgi:hypothetical protein